jgi:hypothetical protein
LVRYNGKINLSAKISFIANSLHQDKNVWMPRKPTLIVRQARVALLDRVKNLPKDTCLPPLGELGEEFQLHPSTIFRMLRDLATEGLVWQSPTGKFFPVSAQRKTLRGAPVCFIGRELWQWSRLYHEMLEGISEVCSANGSPLLQLSSRSLIRQEAAALAPEFASPHIQITDLVNLIGAVPKGCAGFVFDHLWCDKALGKARFPGGERIQLLYGSGRHAAVLSPDYQACAMMAADFARQRGRKKIALIIPFHGDPAMDAAISELRRAFVTFSTREVSYSEIYASDLAFRNLTRRSDLLICPEDNITGVLANRLLAMPAARKPILLGTHGTDVLHAPNIRLRIDFRRLGRAAASKILHGVSFSPQRPSLIDASHSEYFHRQGVTPSA